MEQTSTPIKTADVNEPGTALKPKKYFWQVRPAEIITWTQQHKPELALLAGMVTTSFVISGAAMAVLCSPNLSQPLSYEPLIDDTTLAESLRSSLGEQFLGQVARVLEIEIVETQGPEVGRHPAAAPAMTIVAQADKAAHIPEADVSVGLKAMLLAAGVGLGITGLMRLIPLIPFSAIGPRRRQPLSQRLGSSDISSQPLAPIVAQKPVSQNQAIQQKQALIPGAMSSLVLDTNLDTSNVGLPQGQQRHAAGAAPANPSQHSSARANGRRNRKPFLGRRLGQKPISAQAVRHESQGNPGIQTKAPVTPPGGMNNAVQNARSQSSKQPISFVTLSPGRKSSVSKSSFASEQNFPQPSKALWSSPKSSSTQGKSAASVQFGFLDELDIRRQYPLDDRNARS